MGRRDFNDVRSASTWSSAPLHHRLVICALKTMICTKLLVHALELKLSSANSRFCTHHGLKTRAEDSSTTAWTELPVAPLPAAVNPNVGMRRLPEVLKPQKNNWGFSSSATCIFTAVRFFLCEFRSRTMCIRDRRSASASASALPDHTLFCLVFVCISRSWFSSAAFTFACFLFFFVCLYFKRRAHQLASVLACVSVLLLFCCLLHKSPCTLCPFGQQRPCEPSKLSTSDKPSLQKDC